MLRVYEDREYEERPDQPGVEGPVSEHLLFDFLSGLSCGLHDPSVLVLLVVNVYQNDVAQQGRRDHAAHDEKQYYQHRASPLF